MIRRTLLSCATAVVPLFTFCGVVSAQLTDSQTFRVNVPNNISITAPSALVVLTHDETDNDQAFPGQLWDVRANSILGATVTFSTNQPFVHTADWTFVRNARLDLAISSSSGPANWTVVVASDQTNYTAWDGIATVQAVSNRPGRATFDLAVTFITTQWDTLAAGDYETVVTGTIAAN